MSNDSYGDYSVDEDDQLQPEDTLEDTDLDDVLDRGIAPPDRWSAGEGFGNTHEEAAEGETLDMRIKQEDPELDPYLEAEEETLDEIEGDYDPETGEERAGRLVDPNEGIGEDTTSDLIGEDVGIDGAGASAEEAAVHVIDEE